MGAAVLRLAGLPCVGPVREEIGARCAAIGVRPLVTDSGAKRTGGGVASAAAARVCWQGLWLSCRAEVLRARGELLGEVDRRRVRREAGYWATQASMIEAEGRARMQEGRRAVDARWGRLGS
jgi:hypothetical protein